MSDDDFGYDPKEQRPKKRGRLVAGRVPDDVYAEAKKRADAEGRSLGEIIRAFLFGWARGEYPSPASPPGDKRRAKKRRRKQE